ncbi:hypothetical protein NM208_g589 [Fusarium decemcellulare]|uniref:Uncharacterized protein n=1 Tax=Fusarium decemcellulare TaxID=57161 RepID=A0ACC1SZ17_9HYPO|nr:hypothetical protein NM208_g589 [Fusarium decemcellulare]
MPSRSEPYRIAVFGPGDVGSVVIREAARLPEFQVVGALVFQEKKDNVDVGTLVGIQELGVKATRNLDKFLAIECDAVVHTALDSPSINALEDFRRLLEAGKNVVTCHPYSYLPARPAQFGKVIKAAALKGQATFYAGGLNPDFITQRLAVLLTGLSNDVQRIKIEEYFDCEDQTNAGNLQIIGLGGDPQKAMDENGSAVWYQKHFWFQMIQHISYELGVKIDRIEATSKCEPAPEDIVRPTMTIKKGQTGIVSYESTGYVGDKPFISILIGWYQSPIMKPAHVKSETEWIVTIEGRPSSRTVLDLKSSFFTDAKHVDGEPLPPGYHSFGVSLLQSVPMTVEAKPGFKAPDVPAVHWKKDQRENVAVCYREG